MNDARPRRSPISPDLQLHAHVLATSSLNPSLAAASAFPSDHWFAIRGHLVEHATSSAPPPTTSALLALPQLSLPRPIDPNGSHLIFDEHWYWSIAPSQATRKLALLIEILSMDPVHRSDGLKPVALAFTPVDDDVSILGQDLITTADRTLQLLLRKAQKLDGLSIIVRLQWAPRPLESRVTRRPRTAFEVEAPRFTYDQLIATVMPRPNLSKQDRSSKAQLLGSVLNLAGQSPAPRRNLNTPCRIPTHPRVHLAADLQCTSLAFSSNGLYLAVAARPFATSVGVGVLADRPIVKIYDLVESVLTVTLTGPGDAVHALAWNPASTDLFGIADRSLAVWNFQGPASRCDLILHPVGVKACAVWPGSDEEQTVVLTGSDDGVIRKWCVPTKTRRPVEEATTHTMAVSHLAWDHDGKRFFSCDVAGNAMVWLYTAGKMECIKILEGVADGPLYFVTPLVKSKRVVYVSKDRIQLFDYMYRKTADFALPPGACMSGLPTVSSCSSHIFVPTTLGTMCVSRPFML
ncbi:hypothetical protein AMAG_17904 [Allomyces macrogynus ATCC 38327]|uniref:Uncharacterized protein n=1 Tax=Allomyces macrogynus (strain ATCC 38327) TaxID=578462 RepID=A0A0L0S1Q2_ALLM3|nr:hypothetical protein AMAG_17904 [Allomyces macrogynus ATCC 38327]|eukprot:KNE56350.1 hypothetical protein AMAG_17904 [Allomyces macrogynus ATCC 38327]